MRPAEGSLHRRSASRFTTRRWSTSAAATGTRTTECIPGPVVKKCVQEPGCWTWDPCCCRCVYVPRQVPHGLRAVPAAEGLQEGLGLGNEAADDQLRPLRAGMRDEAGSLHRLPLRERAGSSGPATTPPARWCRSSRCGTAPTRPAAWCRRRSHKTCTYRVCHMVPETGDTRSAPTGSATWCRRTCTKTMPYTVCHMVPRAAGEELHLHDLPHGAADGEQDLHLPRLPHGARRQ